MNMIEEWKVVEGFSRYKVSHLARVWDTQRDVEVAQMLSGIPEYYYVNMQRDDGERKLVRVHRLVAKAFVGGETDEFRFVDHIDRNKVNNIPSNLRWVDNSGNQRNLDSNIYVGGVLLKEYVLRYEDPEQAYSYLTRVLRTSNQEDAIKQYEEYLVYGQRTVKVIYEDSEYYLLDLCNEYNKSYETVMSRLSQGWPVWNALFGIPYKYVFSFQLKGKLVDHWYPTKEYFRQMHNRSLEVLSKLIEQDFTFEEILSYTGQNIPTYEVDGVIATMEEHCTSRGLSVSSVRTRMTKNGISLKEALIKQRQKVKVITINGITKSPKLWSEEFGLKPKTVIGARLRLKCSFKEVFEYFGVDTSEMIFQEG